MRSNAFLLAFLVGLAGGRFIPPSTPQRCDAQLCPVGADDAFGQQTTRGTGWSCWAEPSTTLPEGYAVFCDPAQS